MTRGFWKDKQRYFDTYWSRWENVWVHGDFAAIDSEDTPLVAVINETMAKQFFPGEDPLGKRFTTGFSNASGQWTQVVGVVRDTKYASLGETAQSIVYMPLIQRHTQPETEKS